MRERKIQRGDIYHANLNPVMGSEQGGFRPVLVIQNNRGNRYSPTVIVASITSRLKHKMPTHVALRETYGLEKDSVVLLEQLRTLDKTRLENYVETLDRHYMRKVDKALCASLEIRKQNKPVVMELCSQCAVSFYGVNRLCIQKRESDQRAKGMCMFCNVRQGQEYLIKNKRH